ncbi:MAG: peptidylprolyl isomerase [Spirochaetales bacterium]
MQISKNCVVSIHYTLFSDEGVELDSSIGRDPLSYIHGTGQLIPGLERELEGKKVGEDISVTLSPEDGYGYYNEQLVLTLPKDRFENSDSIQVGMEFAGQTRDGSYHIFRVLDVAGDTVRVDGNHPLAGKTLTFNVHIEGIREASPEELSHGHVHTGEEEEE